MQLWKMKTKDNYQTVLLKTDLLFITQQFPKGELILVEEPCSYDINFFFTGYLTLNLAKNNRYSIYFSLERAKERIVEEWKKQLGENSYHVLEGNTTIIDIPCISLDQIYSILKEQTAEYVFIDYIQLIEGASHLQSRKEEVVFTLHRLKEMAHEFNLSIVVFAPLRKGFYLYGNKKEAYREIYSSFPIASLSGIHVKLLHKVASYYQNCLNRRNGSYSIQDSASIYLSYEGDCVRIYQVEFR